MVIDFNEEFRKVTRNRTRSGKDVLVKTAIWGKDGENPRFSLNLCPAIMENASLNFKAGDYIKLTMDDRDFLTIKRTDEPTNLKLGITRRAKPNQKVIGTGFTIPYNDEKVRSLIDDHLKGQWDASKPACSLNSDEITIDLRKVERRPFKTT